MVRPPSIVRNGADSRASIAIIGMSCRFPGAENWTEFWRNLRDGVESITYYSDDDLSEAGVDPSVLSHPNFVHAGSILKDIDLFDAGFFGFTPREAESLDPQKRFFLESAWQALEEAGYDPHRCAASIGVYAGCAMSSYLDELERNPALVELLGGIQVLIGNDKDYLTTLASYKLDLRGPSLGVQTTCSTSLVAVCVACQALLNDQCDMALAGGVCIRVPQKTGYFYEPGGIYSPDGHCRVFDRKAQGVIFGNGVGVVALKRLEDARRDGDAIHAIIRGVAVNNDGAKKSSYSAPSVDGQADVIARAHRMAAVRPRDIGYVEAHGTGTPLGDPIEIAALAKAWASSADGDARCAVGSVKTNFGHLDHAAGVAGLIKTILCLKHRRLVPSLHFEEVNPEIDLANSAFYVNTRLRRWTSDGPRRAGVSAFGIGGTNAHVVLEEAPAARTRKSARPAQLLLLSARSKESLDRSTAALADHLERNPTLSLPDVAYTLQVGRRGFRYRRACVVRDVDDAVVTLRESTANTGDRRPRERSVYFMFSGQGAQYVGMGAELHRVEPTYREAFTRCAERFGARLGVDLERLVHAPAAEHESAAERLRQTKYTQAALFTVEYSLAQLWMEWGIRPKGMIGHSVGEYVAACLAGVLSLDDAVGLVAERGRLMQELPPGSMLAVPLPEAELRELIGPALSVAAVNELSLCVASGPTEHIAALADALATRRIETRRLHTSHAFHSGMMDPILGPFGERVASLRLEAPRLPWVSNLTGAPIDAADAVDPAYWVRHLRGTVRFADGVGALLRDPDAVVLEVGPGQTLSGFARRHPARSPEQGVISSMRHPHDHQGDCEFLFGALGQLWLAGVEIDWRGVQSHERRRRVHLPTYSFDRQRYWAEPRVERSDSHARVVKAPDLSDWFYSPSWRYTVSPEWTERAALSARSNRWLVFEDPQVGPAVVARLQRRGGKVVTVRPGKRFKRASANVYEMDPGDPAHYSRLLAELHASHRFPSRVAHFWGVAPERRRYSELAAFRAQQDRGLYSVLYTAQAIIERDAAAAASVMVVTSGVHGVTKQERLSPSKATVLAACKTIPQEYPSIQCRNIDIAVPRGDSSSIDDVASALLVELTADAPDAVVAYRDGQRWVQFFKPVRIGELARRSPLLRDRGVYLITGGLGNVGLSIAEELARSVRAKLVLIGRAGLPPRGEWARWLLSRGEDDPTCRRIRRVEAIGSLGGQVLTIAADAADEDAMHGAVERTFETFGALHGVIHAAGTIAPETFAPIRQTNPALCEQHFRPKVGGVLTLEKVLAGHPLDFWLMVSSLSSVLGGIGFLGYAAGNVFLDSYAASKHWAEGSPWITINWDAWESPDGEEDDGPSELRISQKEGIEALRRIVSWGALQQVVVSAGSLERRLEQWVTPNHSASLKEPTRHELLVHSRPGTLCPYVAPNNAVERDIADVWQEVLGVDHVGLHDNFFTELNGSSLLATQLVARLRTRFRRDVPLRQLFERPTVAQFALAMESNGQSQERAPG